MKKSGHCPKCNSTDIVMFPGDGQGYGYGVNIPIGMGLMRARQAYVRKYLCMHCGYIELYLDDMQDIEQIRKSL